MAKRPVLVIVGGSLSGRRFEVGASGLRLGRSSSNDIHVPDEELSRNHCLFEAIGETGIRLTDLASANGTFLNGKSIDGEPVDLKEGDLVEAGSTVLRVGEAPAEPVRVDLGLGQETPPATPPAKSARRSPLLLALWGLALLVTAAAIGVFLLAPRTEEAPAAAAVADEEPVLREVSYEKVKADAGGIFRYALVLGEDGVLSVKIDDTANNRRLPEKQKALSAESLAELGDILSFKALREIDREYAVVEPNPATLESIQLKVVYSTRVRRISVVNSPEPEALTVIRERLEAFSKSELGVWAIAYSRDRLVELAEQATSLGQSKWEDREVNYGNLAQAIAAYREAAFYLETVEPKPPCAQVAAAGLERATAELDRRYTDQRFLADRALNLAQWETACQELKVLLEMVPDRTDDRNRDARQKLISAENNLKKGGR